MRNLILSRKRGFTLVELLVVIAIIGILIGMLLPAVQQVREAARRTQCQNNLKQLALAGLNYEGTFGILPDGGRHWPYALSNPPPTGWSWLHKLLPFMEQNNIYDLPLTQTPVVKRTAIPGFFCPSRRAPTSVGNIYSLTDYAGSGGTGGEGGPYNGAIVRYNIDDENFNEQLEISHLHDGTSNTIFAGEKYVNTNWYGGGSWGDNAGYFTGVGWDTMRFGGRAPKGDEEGSDVGSYDMFGSPHPAGFNTSFCDGSVHMIPYSVELTHFRNLINREDGIAVNLDF